MKKLLSILTVLVVFFLVPFSLDKPSKNQGPFQNFIAEKKEMNGSESFKPSFKNGVVAFGEELSQIEPPSKNDSEENMPLQNKEEDLNDPKDEVIQEGAENKKDGENEEMKENEERTRLEENLAILEDYLDKYIMPNIMAIITSIGMVFAVFNRFRKILSLYKTDKEKFSEEKEREFAFLKSEMENALSQIAETKEKTIESVENMPILKMSQSIQRIDADIKKIRDALISFSSLFESLLKSQKLSAEGSLLPAQMKDKLEKIHRCGEDALENLKSINLMDEIKSAPSNEPMGDVPMENVQSSIQQTLNQQSSIQQTLNQQSSNVKNSNNPSSNQNSIQPSSIQQNSIQPSSIQQNSIQSSSNQQISIQKSSSAAVATAPISSNNPSLSGDFAKGKLTKKNLTKREGEGT